MGRLPKPPDQVRRPDRQRWRRLDAPSNPDVPALPERIDGGEWTAEAVTTWGEWWRCGARFAWSMTPRAAGAGQTRRLSRCSTGSA